MLLKEDIPYSKIGLGISLFIGGGLATFATLRYRQQSSQSASEEKIKELTKEIAELKKEIVDLNAKLPQAVEDIQAELKNIRALISERRSLRSNFSVCSFRTANSEDGFEIEGDLDYRQQNQSPIDSNTHSHGDAISNEEKKRALYAKVDALYMGNSEDKEAAMRILQDNEINFREDWEFLWRLGRSHIGIYEIRDLYEEKKTHATAGYEYTEQALELYEPSSDVHKWYAISLGTMTDFVSTKEKIQNGYKLQEHVKRALELSPSDPTLHFMMGRWCWGVYMLTWIERKLAATLFATPPTSTVKDALNSFLKAEEINPGFYKANQLYIAKCYYEMSDYKEAKKWLNSAKAMPVGNKDDENNHREVVQLLAKL